MGLEASRPPVCCRSERTEEFEQGTRQILEAKLSTHGRRGLMVTIPLLGCSPPQPHHCKPNTALPPVLKSQRLCTNTAQPQLSLPFQAHTSDQHIQFFWTNQYQDKITMKPHLQKSGTNPFSVLTHSGILSLPTHYRCQRLQELFTKADPEIFS